MVGAGSPMVALAGPAGPAGPAGTPAGYRLLVLEGGVAKWGEPVLGAGALVTYAVVERERSFDDAINCSTVAPIDRLLSANRIDRAVFEAELRAAFSAWADVASIRFRRSDPAAADILIGADGERRGRAFTNVDARSVGGDPRPIDRAVICLNPAQPWKIGFDGDLEVYDIRYTLMHEIGHAIGLNHPSAPGSVMDFRYREAFSDLQPGDIAGVTALYGPKRLAVDAAMPVAERATHRPDL